MPEEKTPEEIIQEMKAREQAIYDRVDKIRIVNENQVIIYRIDMKQASTFLAIDPRANMDRIRESMYGKIASVSPTPTGDDVKDYKKKMLKRGDVVSYNPDSSFSKNVAGFEEIWIIHIDNVLDIDDGYDPIKAKEDALKRMYEREQSYINAKIKQASLIQTAAGISKANAIRDVNQ